MVSLRIKSRLSRRGEALRINRHHLERTVSLSKKLKRFTGIFFLSIACVTLAVLLVRLVLLPSLAPSPPGLFTDMVEGEHPFAYRYNSKIYFPAPDAEGNLLAENHEESDYYLNIEIFDPDSRDVYMYTGFIEPGTVIDQIGLLLPLPEGVHPLRIRITAHSREREALYEQLGSIEEPIELYVGQRPEAA